MGTISATVGQTGYILIIGPGPYPWIEQDLPITLTRSDEPGFTLDFGYRYNDNGFPLAPALPYTSPADPIAGIAAKVWTLTVETSLTSTSKIPKFYMVLDPKPWGDSEPTTRTDRTNDLSMLVERLLQTSETWVLNANGTTYDLVWEFDFLTTGDNYLHSNDTFTALSSSIRPFHDLVNSPNWNGTMKFHFDADAPITMTINAITFTGEVRDFHYGTMSQPMDVHARAVHCYITGQPYMSHTAVQDDYRDGIMVHPDNYDPADPLDTDYFTPPPGEGVVEDEIPDVE
jgi:hypothetical protein